MGKDELTADDLHFRDLNVSKKYDIPYLTAEGIADFVNRLKDDERLTHKYIIDKFGFDNTNIIESAYALSIYQEFALVGPTPEYSITQYLCSLEKNASSDEFLACVADAEKAMQLVQ